MVICKYYQQGTCKFGSSCRFEHPRSDYLVSGDNAYGARFGAHQYTPINNYYSHAKNTGTYKIGNSPQDEDVMRLVAQEVVQMEKGGQWPLTCFAPIKERACFPGWEDHSPEEIRWKMYEARQNGTLPECQRQIKELYDAAKLRRQNIVLNPNTEVFKIIDKLLRRQKIETETNFSFLQAATQSRDNNFLSWNPQGFSAGQQQTPVSSNFVFTLPQLGPPVQSTVQQPSSVFVGNTQAMSNVSVPSHNVFVSSNEVQPPFSGAVQDTSRFQTPAQPTITTPSAFGENKNVFNSSPGWNKVENTSTDTSVYTSKSELSEDEINAFVAQTFTVGKVPMRPPPKELCIQ
ncbi:nucleoporin NUP42-like [Periplaneta americana]|uniref:nucleoporin NUP42-like n=1 Tax=Periplaneta americana TaxID=6978 RepID=UPI0037E8D16A